MNDSTEKHGEKTPLIEDSVSEESKAKSFCSKKLSITSAVIFIAAVFVALVLVATLKRPPYLSTHLDVVQDTDNQHQRIYDNGAVATDAAQCSAIGRDILRKNGSAVDAAIASMLCVGVHNAQSTGIAGSSFMLIYERPRNGTEMELAALNFREAAPLKATPTMFLNLPPNRDEHALEIAVFGEIAGYWKAWNKFGRLKWAELFQPTINLCEHGYIIADALGDELSSSSFQRRAKTNEGNMRDIFFKKDGSTYNTGDIMKRPKLARTLRRIAEGGAQEFYTGALAEDIVADLKQLGSIITKEDLANYTALWEEPMVLNLNNANMRIATLGAPSGGPVVQLIMQLIDRYDWSDTNYVLQYHRLAEIFKFAYAMKTRLGDPRFVNISYVLSDISNPEFIKETLRRIDDMRTHELEYYEPDIGFSTDRGTSHLSVISPDGGAVAHTSSINTGFGSFRRGFRTGIIFNDGMDDFATSSLPNYWNLPPSYANIIRPGKRPLSSMSPTLVFDRDGVVRIGIGGAGGSRISTSIVNVLWHTLYHGEGLGTATSAPRLHHQLSPNTLVLEKGISPRLIQGLRTKQHDIDISSSIAVVQGIQRICNDDPNNSYCKLLAVSDARKGGIPSGF